MSLKSSPATAQVPQGSVLRNAVRSSGLYSLTLVGQRLAGIALVPFYTRYLAPEDYGVLELLDQISAVFSLLLGAAFSSALTYFYHQDDSAKSRSVATGTALLGSCMFGLLAGAAGFSLAGVLAGVLLGGQQYEVFLQVSAAGVALTFAAETILMWFRLADRPGTFSLTLLLRTIIQIVIAVILLAGYGLRVGGVLWSNVIALAISIAVGLPVLLRSVRLTFDWDLFARMVRFSIPSAFTLIALFIIHFGDRFFLRANRSLADVGIYGIAYKIGMLISFVHASFHTYWSAQAVQLLKRADAPLLFARMFTYLTVVLCACSLTLVVAAHPGVRVLTTPEYYTAAAVVPWIVLAYLARGIGDYFRMVFIVSNRPGFDALCNWLGAAACLAGYFLLIPRYGMTGAAWATLSAFFLIAAVVIPWTARLQPFVTVETTRLLKVAAATGVPLSVFSLFPQPASWPVFGEIAWGAFLILLFPVLLWAFRFLTPQEHRLVVSSFRRNPFTHD